MSGWEDSIFYLASRLGKTVQEVQQEVTASEFHKWSRFFRKEEERKLRKTEKWEYYMCLLIAEVRRSYVADKHKASVKPLDFLFSYDKFKKGSQTLEQRNNALLRMKRSIAAAFGKPSLKSFKRNDNG